MANTGKALLKLKILFIPCEDNNFRPRFLGGDFLFYCFVFLLIFKITASSLLVYFPESTFFADITKIALIDMTNQERDSLGLGNLEQNEKLNEAAALKANHILEEDYFSHWSPDGISPWHWFDQVGYKYTAAGENLAIGFLDSEEVYTAWLNSFSHRENILGPDYQEIGIAVAKGDFQGKETTVVVQLFGTPKKETVVLAENPVKEPAVVEAGNAAEEMAEPAEQESATSGEQVISSAEPIEVVAGESYILDFVKPSAGVMSFLASGYHDLVQKVIYGLLVFVIIALLADVFIRFDIQDKAIILKTCIFIILLVVFIMFDKMTAINFIPHEFRIY